MIDPCPEDDDGRPSDLPPEAERPSCVVPLPGEPRPMCELCDRAPSARRGLCWACYGKLRECGLALPAREPAGRPPTPALRRLLSLFDRPTLIRLRGWIDELLGST